MSMSWVFMIAVVCFVLGYVFGKIHQHDGDPKAEDKPVDRYCINCAWCIDPQSVSPWCGKFRDPVGRPLFCINLRRPDADCGPQGKSWEPITTMEEKQ